MTRTHLGRLLLLALFLLPAAAVRAGDRDRELWYELKIDGSKAGWMSDVVTEAGERLTTTTETMLRVSRDGRQIEISSRSAFAETTGGQPIELEFTQQMSAQKLRSLWKFLDDGVEQTVEQGGRSTRKKLPRPEGLWLPPRAAEQFARERRDAGAGSFQYRTLDPENSGVTPVTISSRRSGDATFRAADGRTVPVSVWKTVSSALPDLEITEHYTSDGVLVYMGIPTPGIGSLEMRVVPKEIATAIGAGPELFTQTFVSVERIRDVMKLRRARLEMRARKGTLPQLPSTGAQRAEMGGSKAVLTIDVDDPMPATEDEVGNDEYTEPSTMVDSADPMVQALARNAVKRAGDEPSARAEAMRKRVSRHISRKGLETAFATASETAQTKQGDCSEHAVLLCAMLRSDGIPARVASGLVYVDRWRGREQFFGWHMWTQALIDGVWVDLDATLPRAYHAAHVLTGTASFADGVADADLSSMLQLLGNVDIEILDLGYE